MGDWYTYTITNICGKYKHSNNFIRLDLDDEVKYEDYEVKYIFCSYRNPFKNLKVDNQIEINWNVTRWCKSGHTFDDNNVIRLKKRKTRNVSCDRDESIFGITFSFLGIGERSHRQTNRERSNSPYQEQWDGWKGFESSSEKGLASDPEDLFAPFRDMSEDEEQKQYNENYQLQEEENEYQAQIEYHCE